MGGRGAGRLRVFLERAALRDQPHPPRRGGRIDCALLRQRRHRVWVQAPVLPFSGPTLGPILWQFAPTKKFDEQDFGAFLSLLPREADGRPIRHVVEVRHDSFRTPAFIALLRGHGVPVVYADADNFPAIADVTGDFVYARLQRSAEDEPTGYSPDALDHWARRFQAWASGGEPDDLPRVDEGSTGERKPRDCFVYFISGAKVRAPAAAMAFLEKLGLAPS
jgi:uncharacterized protein YecE (DUF72 family)